MAESMQAIQEVFAAEEKKEEAVTETEKEVKLEESTSEKEPAALKIMDGENGGEFLVRYLYDDATSMGWLQFIIKYPSGKVIKKLLAKNAPRKVLWDSSGVEVVGEGNDAFAPNILLSKDTAPNGLFMEFERPDFSIPFKEIWKRIVENYNQIPIVPIRASWSLEDVYEELIEVGMKSAESNSALFHSEYVLLTRREIMEVAEEFEMDFITLRGEFASNGWWVTDRGTGYQKSVKVNGKKARYYALKRNRKKNNECFDLENVSKIADTKYEVKDTLKEEQEKIQQIIRKEQEAEQGKRKKGKEPIRIIKMI